MPGDMVIPPHHRFAHFAMAAEFEFLVADVAKEDAAGLAVEIFAEIDRLERELSRFLEGSDIYRINRTQPGKRLRIGAEAFQCLEEALHLTQLTDGAFDVTFGSDIQDSTAQDAMGRIALHAGDLSVEVRVPGVRVDLGGIGKGFALDWVGNMLEDWEMTHALIQVGGSSILALDPPEGLPGWPVGVGEGQTRRVYPLSRRAISASGTEVKGEHICDPRRRPEGRRCERAWALADGAGFADALSTAFMLMRPDEVEALCHACEGVGAALTPLGSGAQQERPPLMTFGAFVSS